MDIIFGDDCPARRPVAPSIYSACIAGFFNDAGKFISTNTVIVAVKYNRRMWRIKEIGTLDNLSNAKKLNPWPVGAREPTKTDENTVADRMARRRKCGAVTALKHNASFTCVSNDATPDTHVLASLDDDAGTADIRDKAIF